LGLVIPQSGQFAILGNHVREAFTLWDKANPQVFSDIVEGDDGCSEETGMDAAAAMTEAGVDIVVGLSVHGKAWPRRCRCFRQEGIPVMTLTVRADIIGEEAESAGMALLPSRAQEPARKRALRRMQSLRLWADKSFALIEDGAISGRELVEAIRAILEERGLKPTFVDNYRPGQATQPSLLRRLKAAGVSRVFVGGERADLAVIAAEAANCRGWLLVSWAVTRSMLPQGELPLPERTLAVLVGRRDPRDRKRMPRARPLLPEGLVLEGLRAPAYAAAEILGAVATRLGYGETRLEDLLRQSTFSTALGTGQLSARRGTRRTRLRRCHPGEDGAFHRRMSFEDMEQLAGTSR
jgi:branched-chain amino acid transport system substrate-binding protein